jgi:uncharacterized membrane protein YeaQ/YmgE (transglycosylase-associated protein family)
LPRRVASPVSAYPERVILAIFVVLVVLFVILPLIGVALWWLVSTAVVGLIVGALGRLIVPGAQRIGLLATIACGLIGSLIGGGIGHAVGGRLVTILLEIGVAAVAVAIWEGVGHRRLPGGRPAIGGRRW